jgi:hypothetical protein
MNDLFEEDQGGDLQFSTFVENDMWFVHDEKLDVEFGLDQTQSLPPEPVSPSVENIPRPVDVHIDE